MRLDPPGILRRLDRLGRVLIPPRPRDAAAGRGDAGWALAPAAGGLPRPEPDLVCVFCGAVDHVIPHRGKGICVDCVREVREMVSGG